MTTQNVPTSTPPAPLASYDCTFDDPNDDTCTPKPNDRNDFDWRFRQAGVRPNNQAPVYDHTTSTSAGGYPCCSQSELRLLVDWNVGVILFQFQLLIDFCLFICQMCHSKMYYDVDKDGGVDGLL